jgi:hypothetical protein
MVLQRSVNRWATQWNARIDSPRTDITAERPRGWGITKSSADAPSVSATTMFPAFAARVGTLIRDLRALGRLGTPIAGVGMARSPL